MTNVQIQNLTVEELQSMIANTVITAISSIDISPRNYSKKGFAEVIGKSQSFVDAERRAGRLEWVRVGGSVRIPSSELEKYS